MAEGQDENIAGLLKRIDDRTSLMLEIFNRHVEQDRIDFAELRREINALPAAAALAARTALVEIGFDTANPTEHQKDMAILREVRDMAERGSFFEPLRAARDWKDTQDTVKRAGLRAATGILVAAVLGLLWMGFADKIRALFHA